MALVNARDLDPAVWAAAYGAAYATQAEAVRLAGAEGSAIGVIGGIVIRDAEPDKELMTRIVERCRQVADDAVLALHPEGLDRREILDRLARATVHPEALRPPLPLPEPIAANRPMRPGPTE